MAPWRGSRHRSYRGRPWIPRNQRSGPGSRSSVARSTAPPVTPLSQQQRSSISAGSPAYSRPTTLRPHSVPVSELSAAPNAHQPETIEADEDADFLQEIVMAVEMKQRGTVGCAYYVAQQEKMYLMEDSLFGNADLVECLKLIVNPTVVLLSTHADDSIMSILDPEARAQNDEHDAFSSPYLFELRPTSEFDYEAGKSKLATLSMGFDHGIQNSIVIPGDATADDDLHTRGMDGETGLHAQVLRLSGLVTLDSRLTVGCAGAIINYLQRRRAARFLPGDAAAHALFRITSLEMLSLKDTMYISVNSLHALQVLQSESHPHIHNQGPTKGASGSKEGLSIYGLFLRFAWTPQGKYLLRQQFLRPSTSLDKINQRLDTLAVLLNPANTNALEDIVKSLKSIVNIRMLMIKLRTGVSGGSSKAAGIARSIWSGLQKFAYHSIGILRRFEEIISAERLEIYAKIKATFDASSLGQIGRLISEVVDFEQSAEQHRMVVKPGIDEDLDEKKRLYEGINDLLTHVAKETALTVPEGLPTVLNVIFFPQIGFLIAMPMDPDTGRSLWEGNENEAWDRMFASEAIVYYKNDTMRAMDDEIGDIHSDICDREIEIIYHLAQRVLEYETLLAMISDICGELDCLCALAQAAKQYNLARPRMSDQNILVIEQGRHLLQELTVPSYVPNDTYLVGSVASLHATNHSPRHSPSRSCSSPAHPGSSTSTQAPLGPSMLIITGPNYSGKSIYLKQAALIVYLAHVGSFVPAAAAHIGITDKLLTCLAIRETVSSSHSAFMTDLQQLSLALSSATPRSLLLVDEFGKGTAACDGAALVCATFEHLLQQPAPKVLAATHFHEIFEHGFLTPEQYPALAFGHMQVRLDETASSANGQVTYLYNFRPGRSNASFGTLCAAMNGVPPEVVRRAEELVLLGVQGRDLVEACAIMPEGEQEELERAERVARRLLEVDVEGEPRSLLEEILAAGIEAA